MQASKKPPSAGRGRGGAAPAAKERKLAAKPRMSARKGANQATASSAARRQAAERDVAALRLELERREADCEARRAALKREMDRLCRDYEDAASAALELRAEFEAGEEEIRVAARAKADARARRSDAAIRAQLEKEALALGFRMSPRGGDGGG